MILNVSITMCANVWISEGEMPGSYFDQLSLVVAPFDIG